MQTRNKTFAVNFHAVVLGSILLAAFIFIIHCYQDFGITWDETVQSRYGELAWDYYASGGNDTRCNSYLNLRFYGPLFELVAATLYRQFPALKWDIRHLLVAFTALLGVMGVIKFARLFADPWIPIFSALFLIMLPAYVGHAFGNSKDIPFACAFTWAMYFLTHMWRHGSAITYGQCTRCGLCIGVAMAIRIGGVMLWLFLPVIGGFHLIIANLKTNSISREKLVSLTIKLLLIPIISWGIMIVCWPWAHQNPILHPWQALKLATEFSSTYHLLYAGSSINSNALPWHYLPWYLLITTPLTLLIFIIFGIFAGVKALASKPQSELSQPENRQTNSTDCAVLFSLFLWFLFPILYFVVMRPNVYDGIRHFLFLQPAMAIIGGYGAAAIYRQCQRQVEHKLLLSVLLMLLLCPLLPMVRLHPYQYTYFNEIVGGVAQAGSRYESDYWLTSYKEAAEWINQEKKRLHKQQLRILLAANNNSRTCFDSYLDDGIQTELLFSRLPTNELPPGFDYYVATTRFGLSANFPASTIVKEIGRQSAIFTVIKGH